MSDLETCLERGISRECYDRQRYLERDIYDLIEISRQWSLDRVTRKREIESNLSRKRESNIKREISREQDIESNL